MDITPAQTTSVRAVIDGVYPGSRYDDACLAEIEAWGKDKVMEPRPAGQSGAGIQGTGYFPGQAHQEQCGGTRWPGEQLVSISWSNW